MKAHVIESTDLTQIPSGTSLVKFVAKDESLGDFTVELHGFVTESGDFYITDEIITHAKEESGAE